MHSIKARVLEMKPAFILVYLSLTGCLCMYAVQRYLGSGFDAVNCLSFMGIIFGVYTLNRFTDTAEDFTNDIGKLLFFQKKRMFLWLAVSALAGSIAILVAERRLNWMHFLLLAMGFGYSYRIIPWFSLSGGYRLMRIKEMTFLKNLSVSFLWGASVFVVPLLNAPSGLHGSFAVWMLGAGLFLSTLNNTLFDDILDEPGDRVAGIRTLPTAWGVRKSQFLLLSLDALWLAGVAALGIAGRIDASHALFLAALGLYPFVYIGLNLSGRAPKGLVDALSESDLFLFAAGMLLLSLR